MEMAISTVVAWQVLVINYLTASTLWHRFIVMEPPDELICRIQRALVDFFWSRQHCSGQQHCIYLLSKVARGWWT